MMTMKMGKLKAGMGVEEVDEKKKEGNIRGRKKMVKSIE